MPNRTGSLEVESLVKDFKPLTLGEIHLEEGRKDLVLKATDVPGSQVMDVRMVVMTFNNGSVIFRKTSYMNSISYLKTINYMYSFGEPRREVNFGRKSQ